MKKRKIAIILSSVLLFSGLSGCGASNPDSGNLNVDVPSNSSESNVDISNDDEAIENRVEYSFSEITSYPDENVVHCSSVPSCFSEGKAWVWGQTYGAECIDTSGNILFTLGENMYPCTSFSNGYALIGYFSAGYHYAIIDENGKVINTIVYDDETKLMSYGDGYTIVREYTHGFDEDEYRYYVHDLNGGLIGEMDIVYHINDEFDVDEFHYCGNDVFEVLSPRYNGGSRDKDIEYFYFANRNKIISSDDIELIIEKKTNIQSSEYELVNKVNFNGEYALLTTIKDGENGIFVYMDKNGDIFVKNGIGIAWSLSEGKILTKGLKIYNVSNGEIFDTPEKYADRLYMNENYIKPVFDDGKVVLPFKGDDGHYYVTLIDDKGNAAFDPIICYKDAGASSTPDEAFYSENRLIVKTDNSEYTILDEKGQKIYSVTEENRRCNYPYSEGFCYFRNSNSIKYYNLNGDQPFEEISFTNSTIELQGSMITD